MIERLLSERIFDSLVFNPLRQARLIFLWPPASASMGKKRRGLRVQRVRELEHGSLAPLLLAATGGMANAATVFSRKLHPFL